GRLVPGSRSSSTRWLPILRGCKVGALKVAGSNDTSGTDVVLCFRPGTSGYNPAWYTLANTGIAWDPVAGNDNASGARRDPAPRPARRDGSPRAPAPGGTGATTIDGE